MVTQLVLPTPDLIAQAAGILASGGLVAFPTETVYGLGANALNEKAVQGIFAAKGRPQDNPLIVHVNGQDMARTVCHWDERAQLLADAFWPGPLTLVLPKLDAVPAVVSARLSTVGVRMPNHPVALALIKETDLPLAAPSANISGRPSPTQARHVLEDFGGTIPIILDGGACDIGLESTVLDISGIVPTILRPGAVTPEQIAMVAGECQVSPAVTRDVLPGEKAPSPGMRHRHYAPRASMTLVKGDAEAAAAYIRELYDKKENAVILAFSDHLPLYGARRVCDLGGDAAEAAHRLFYLLRELDSENVDLILSETLPETGLGLAVMNRLARAAAFHVVDAGGAEKPAPGQGS